MAIFARLFILLVPFLFTSVAQAADYPNKTIRLIVPYSPGGGTDSMARLLGREIADQLNTSVIIENRPGASGNIGTAAVSRSKPDGYTLLFTSSGHTINPSIFKELPFDPVSDFTPISQVAVGPSILVVNTDSDYESMHDLIAGSDSDESLTFGSAGIGQPTHLAAESFAAATSTPVLHVPYSGSGDAELGLAAGQVDFLIDSIPAALPFISAGNTRALAITGEARFPLLPEVPTMIEEGLDGFSFTTWWGVLAPKGMPEEQVSLMASVLDKAMQSEEIKKRFIEMGATPELKHEGEFAKYIEQEMSSYQSLISNLNLTLN